MKKKDKSTPSICQDSQTTPAMPPMPLDVALKLTVGKTLGDWDDRHIEMLAEDLVSWVEAEERPIVARWIRERRIAPSLLSRWLAEGKEARSLCVEGSPKKKFLDAWEWARMACNVALEEGALYRKLDVVMACKLHPLTSDAARDWEREKLMARNIPQGPQQLEIALSPGRALTQQRIEVGGPAYEAV